MPTAFFQLCLGPLLKYSSCYYPRGMKGDDLAGAEVAMLELTCARAKLENGQAILELVRLFFLLPPSAKPNTPHPQLP